MTGPKKIDLNKIRTYSFKERPTKAEVDSFAKIPSSDWEVDEFLEGLPAYLKAVELKNLVNDINRAKARGRAVILMMGAHSLKVGLAPVLIELIKRGFITHLACNGAVLIHDYEFAFFGRSSEDVAETLETGMFGMVSETPEYLNKAVNSADSEAGLGMVIGTAFNADKPDFIEYSLVASAVKYGLSPTVHITIGADTIHQHPDFDAGKWGALSGNDFRILAESCISLNDGGVVINLGSAVNLPEVFLKALNTARNIHGEIKNFSAANIDMIQHYRPVTNVVNRPTLSGGGRYTLTGHFEILIPLIAWALLSEH
ncbi:MAG: hypothetical protein GF307_04450 [candidate division Zixibacteria bacterium]|nr:hypothetical protein [candidate division Zixibacteria bacterium]